MQHVKIDGLAGYLTVEAAAKALKMTPDGVVKIVRRHNVPYPPPGAQPAGRAERPGACDCQGVIEA